jgi:uncharacterized protein YerC
MKPQREIRDLEYEKCIKKLFQTFITFSDSFEAEKFLREILTESEFLMLKRRWHVASLLNEGLNIRQVARQAQVSSQTVQSVKKSLLESQIWISYLPKEKHGDQEKPNEGKGSDSEFSRKYLFG